jgi:serine/threonine-protein kinase HipA
VATTLPFSREEFLVDRARRHTSKISISGVQPKLGIKLTADKTIETTNEHFTHILKPSPESYPEAAANEHLSMMISKTVGIDTAACGLLRFSTGELAYCTKRFDLENGQKIHQEDMMQAMGIHPLSTQNAKYASKSYEDVGCFLKENSSIAIAMEFFKRVFFNFMISNDDYHLKNISIQYDKRFPGDIKLSPHYDALNTGVFGVQSSELALAIIKEEFTPSFNKWGYHTRQCFEDLASKIGLPNKMTSKIYHSYLSKFEQIKNLVYESYLSAGYKEKYIAQLEERHEKFLRT